MADPKANEGSTVNHPISGESFNALTAPTFQGRGTTTKLKLKEPNPAATASPRKREFDRHDGTERGHETEKKHGAGKGNWGQEVDAQAEDLELEVQDSLAREAELAAAGPSFVAAGDVPGEEGALTLDEYEAKQKKA